MFVAFTMEQQRLAVTRPVGTVGARHMSPATARPSGLREMRDSAGRDRIRQLSYSQALDQTDWNVSSAARLLGIERTSLHKRMRLLGLSRP